MFDKKSSHPAVQNMLSIFGALALAIVFFFLIYRFDYVSGALNTLVGFVRPFIFGGVIAYLLDPVCNKLERFFKKKLPAKIVRFSPAFAVAISILLAILIIFALGLLIIPQLIESIATLAETLPAKVEALVPKLQAKLENNEVLLSAFESAYESFSETFDNWITGTVLPNMTGVLTGVGSGVKNAVVGLKDFLIGIIVAIYCLSERKTFARQSKMILYAVLKPEHGDAVLDEVQYADRMFTGFLSGKLLDSAIIGVLCYLFCILAKMPSPLLLAVIIGITNIIPFFGPIIGAVPCAFLVLMDSPKKMLIFLLFIVILQTVDGNIIGPAILGDATGVSSFWVLFSILLFGGLFGFVGMIIGVPLFAVIYDILRQLVHKGLNKHGKEDEFLMKSEKKAVKKKRKLL